MTHAKSRAAAILALPLGLLLLTGCSMSSAGSATAADSAATSGANGAAADSEDAAADDGTATFGKTYTYDDGLAITVSDKGKYKPSEYVDNDAKSAHQWQITIKNGGKKKFDAALFQTSLQDGEDEADEIFDVAKGFKGNPSTKLRPGRTVKFKVAYGVDTKDWVMDVTPDFSHDEVTFASK